MRKSLILLLAVFFIGTYPALSRSSAPEVISGIVIYAEDNEPIPGASVLVKDTKLGTVTDINGEFRISKLPEHANTLVISFVGAKTKEVPITSGRITVVLESSTEQLDEIVVTGYGNVKKSSYTGSASVLNTDKHKDLPVISMTQMMEANMPGVRLINSNGSPGSNTSIRVRGYGSLSASNAPLFVLDGVPVESGSMTTDDMNGGGMGILSTINPSDIESITVLKDAA